MSRTTARRHAFALIFQLGFHNKEDYSKLPDIYFDNHMLEDVDKTFIYEEFSGTSQNLDTIDEKISVHLKGWSIERLNKVDIAIMRLAVYEILFDEGIPESVSVNEAVELAKHYSIDDAAGFINGVLGSVVKSAKDESL